MLPDDVLIDIFGFYVDEDINEDLERTEVWKTLAHVCRRWRSVVFQSSRRLNLRLLCTTKTRTRDTLNIWPPLPLIVRYVFDGGPSSMVGIDNITAALEHNDRICQIELVRYPTRPESEYVMAMLKPFPELTHLRLDMYVYDGPGVLPDSFLDGSAPRLRSLVLDSVPFPGLPKLLLSATHLVNLDISRIPRPGYIPPEAMATGLSALTSLESLHLHFLVLQPRPAPESQRPRPPPLTRFILPSLAKFRLAGTSEYLEEILAHIDAPRLDLLDIGSLIFGTPVTLQLFQFISRSPTLRALKKACVAFDYSLISIRFPSQTSDCDVLSMRIPCMATEWPLSSLGQVFPSSLRPLPPISTLEDLYIREDEYWRQRLGDIDNMLLWLDLLRSFVAVKNLYLSEELMLYIAPALQGLVRGRTTEILPTLENIFLKGLGPSTRPHEGIENFVAARRLTGQPVAVSCWDGIYDR